MTHSPSEMAEYARRRIVLHAGFSALPRGTQTKASFDTRISPTKVSRVLKGSEIDERVLETLEEWLRKQPTAVPA